MLPKSTPFPTLGILGGGQLGRMTAAAALRLGLHVRFLAPNPTGPIQALGETTVTDWEDPATLRAFAAGCTAVTAESEWAPLDRLAELEPEGVAVWPRPETIRLIRDKGLQKRALADAGLPVPDFTCCDTLDRAQEAADAYGYPVLIKKYRGSYDGYGNETVHDAAALRSAWQRLADEDGLLVEAWVPFIRELAVLVARRPGGGHVVYPIACTEQRDHRCHAVVVPASTAPQVAAEARHVALSAVETVRGVGIIAVELFELEDGRILINELAPRPHNTGHYSIEGCYTSQFENHVRAVLDWPLGQPGLREPVAVMVNILGHRRGTPGIKGLTEALAVPNTAIHIYGKTEVRPKRKMGHVTATGTDPGETRSRAETAASLIQL